MANYYIFPCISSNFGNFSVLLCWNEFLNHEARPWNVPQIDVSINAGRLQFIYTWRRFLLVLNLHHFLWCAVSLCSNQVLVSIVKDRLFCKNRSHRVVIWIFCPSGNLPNWHLKVTDPSLVQYKVTTNERQFLTFLYGTKIIYFKFLHSSASSLCTLCR